MKITNERINRPGRWNHGLTTEENTIAARWAGEIEEGRRNPQKGNRVGDAARKLVQEWRAEERREAHCIARAERDNE